jgi:hypothetical protein
MLKQEHCDLVEELVTGRKKKVIRTFESKQKQHNQQHKKTRILHEKLNVMFYIYILLYLFI